jgi:putative ATP-binding cassette transporter
MLPVGAMIKLNRHFLTRFVSLASPYWSSEEKWTAWTLLTLLVVLMLGEVGAGVLLNQQAGELMSALADKDASRFWQTIYACLAMLVVAVPIYGLYYFVCDKLGIRWRRWMTRTILNRYFSNHAYYELNADARIDNPDQRIAEDIKTFTERSLFFLPLIVWAVIQVTAFSGVLWSISHTLVYFLVLYAVLGTAVTMFLFGRALIGLQSLQLRKEANFRFGLVRIRENAESIALYRGEQQELAHVEKDFDSVYENSNRLINRQLFLNLFSYGYKNLTIVLPSAIIATQVISGELEVGRAVEAAGAFTAILTALAIVVSNFNELSRFAAGTERLDTFLRSLEDDIPRRVASRQIHFVRSSSLAIHRLSLRTLDDQRWIVRNLTANIRPGDGLVIVGPSGSGKSSLLRAIAGLTGSGSGSIIRPGLEQMLFLPQKPYMVLGSLRNQLLYPFTDRYHFDGELLKVLDRVNLPYLADQFGGLDAEADWANVLSVGEQQRLAFARVLITQPRYAMLDEATSALDAKNEDRLYQLLAGTPTTFVSVSHHDALLEYHQNVLELLGDGRWDLFPVRQYSATG